MTRGFVEQNVGGAGAGFGGGGISWLPDNKRFLFLSEKTGYMHLYSLDTSAAKPEAKALTTGAFEVTNAQLSKDRTKCSCRRTKSIQESGTSTPCRRTEVPRKITSMTGSNEATVSPDERAIALIYS